MRSANAPGELPAQELVYQIARLLAAGVLRLRKCGTSLAEISRPGPKPTPESGRQGLEFSNELRLSDRAG